MSDTVASLTLLEELRATKTEDLNALATFVEKRGSERDAFEAREKSEDVKPSDEERSAFAVAEEAFDAEFGKREAALKTLTRRIAEQEVIEERRQDAAKASSGVQVSITHQPLTYNRDNAPEVSYFRDLAARHNSAFASQTADASASFERLERHSKEMAEEMPKRSQERERRADREVEQAEKEFRGSIGQRRGLDQNPFERRVNPNRTDGQGGYLVPPIWLIDDYIPYLRAGRVAADLCRSVALPPGTDSINIPKIATGTLTGVQTADAAAVTSQDFTDTSVTAGVKTIAGQQDVSIQLLEQSPGQIVDQVVMEDLLADYNLRVDAQVLTGTGANGQVLGLLPVSNYSSTNTITYTEASPLGQSFNMAVGAAASKTAYTRYSLDNVHAVMHPRRWFWFATALDGASGTSGRPLVNKLDTGFNVSAVSADPAPYQGYVGHFPFGLNAYIDGNMPAVATAAGAISGGTSDLGLVAKWDDLWLFEGEMRTRVLPEILSGTLQVRFQCFNYFAFLVRYGQSIAVIQGTGMAAPVSATAGGTITY